MLAIILLPIGGFFIYGNLIQKDVYTETYYAELNDKVERLSSRENKKIVFIGGSSLIFGLRSEEIEKATGYDVVDFGLYASLGTPIMMKLAEPYIKKDDVVVIAPEINEQTYSSYIGYEAALKCFENMNYPFGIFSLDENMKFFFHYFKFVVEKGGANIELSAPYDKASFNEYGDIDNPIVSNNQLANYYDSTQPIEPNNSLLDEQFIQEINSLNKRLSKRGATVFFSFSPTNTLALRDDGLEEFEVKLDEKLNCEILGSVKDFTYHQYYFYDTNFHLNRNGSYVHSNKLANLLIEKLGLQSSYEVPTMNAPEPKYYSSDLVETIDGGQYRQVFEDGKMTYSFVGVDNSLKDVKEFTIPSEINGVKVSTYGPTPFKDMPNLEKVTIPSTVLAMMETLFSNCPNCIGVYLEHDKPPLVCSNGLIDGASSNCKIYIHRSVIRNFTSDYTWVNYRSYMVAYD